MIQRVLASKSLVAYVLACVTGLTLYFRWPFPEDDLMLHLIALRAPNIYAFFKYSYTLFLFTTLSSPTRSSSQAFTSSPSGRHAS